VPFDPRATAPSCANDTLCFDSARFLLGDFDGDGKADLMVITARHGGTAFWLLRSTGNRFEAPRLWLQTDNAFRPEQAQQYVAADFSGTGRAGVLIAQKRPDSGLDLWLASSTGSAGAAPVLMAQAKTLGQNANLLPVQDPGSRASLVAVERADGRLALTQIVNEGTRMTVGERRQLPANFLPDFVKVTIGAVRGKASNTLILLTPHLDGTAQDAVIDIATLDTADARSVPVQAATLRGMSWSDVFPLFVRDKRNAALVLYRRIDATLGDFYFTGGGTGAGALSGRRRFCPGASPGSR
jgi:FG-GAP repeat.